MTRAIIFDCFGVLASDGWLPFKRKYFGTDPDLFEQATDLNKAVDSGLASYDDFIAKVAALARISSDAAAKEIEQNPANDELFNYIRDKLKPHYKLGLLSNAGANWLPELFQPWQIELFDDIVLSFESGFIKPDPRAYATILDKLGLEAKDCVFIDDQERYCTAAREQGMEAIVYTSFEQFRSDIERILR